MSAGEETAISPLLPAAALIFFMDILGVPLLIWSEGEGYNDPTVREAYVATVVAVGILVAGTFAFGIHRRLRDYQLQSLQDWSPERYAKLWRWTALLAVLGIGVMWLQAGFRIPVVEVYGKNFATYALLRSEFDRSINQTLLGIVLYLLATPNAIIAWLYLPGDWPRRAGSVALVAAAGAFTVARSPLGLAGLFVLNYALLTRSISKRVALAGGAFSIGAMVLAHSIAGGAKSYEVHGSLTDYLVMRIVYGEWMGLPTFFDVFQHTKAPPTSLLHPTILQVIGIAVDSPARTIMIATNPEAVSEDRAGVVSAFFVGDAYAVWGAVGVAIAPFVVLAELWAAVAVVRRLPKTPITAYLAAWMLFKFLTGVLTGFSGFLFAGLPAMIVFLGVVGAAYRVFGRTLADAEAVR